MELAAAAWAVAEDLIPDAAADALATTEAAEDAPADALVADAAPLAVETPSTWACTAASKVPVEPVTLDVPLD